MRTLQLLSLTASLLIPTVVSAQLRVPSRAALGQIGLERMWLSQARVNPGSDHVTHLTVDERNVYVQASNGSMTAFDAESGRRRWVVQLGPANRISFPAVSNADLVVVVTGTRVYAVEKSSGHIAWTAKMPQSASTSAAIDDEFFYVGTLDGSVYAFNFEVVSYFHRNGRLPGSFDPSTKTITRPVGTTAATQLWMWRYRTGHSMRQPPARSASSVLLGDTNGHVYGIVAGPPELQGGKLRFQFKAGSDLSAPMTTRDDIAFISTSGNEVIAVDSMKGQVFWRYRLGHRIMGAPLLLEDRLHVTAEGEGLFAIDIESGEPVEGPTGPWWIPRATAMLGATQSMVYASDRLWNVVAVDRQTGRPRGSLSLRSFKIRYHNDLNDRLYMATSGGAIMCLRGVGSEEPTFYRNQDRTPITPLVADEEQPEKPAADPDQQ